MDHLGHIASVLVEAYGPAVYQWSVNKLKTVYDNYQANRARSNVMSSYERLDLEPSNANFPRKASRILARRYKRPFIRARRTLTRRRTGRRYGQRRFKTAFRPRLARGAGRRYRRTTRRFGRRTGRVGRRGRRYGRVKRQTFKAKVRKIVGNCFNQFFVWDRALLAPSWANRLTKPNLFRICSGWYGTREEMLRIMCAALSGPSSTAGTDQNLNRHIWIQKCVENFTLHTPSKVPVFYKLYRISLKCADRGSTGGTYVEGTLPFASGSATATANLPSASYWSFWDQASRQGATVSGYLPVGTNQVLAYNTAGTLAAPTTGAIFESGNNGGEFTNLQFSTPLGFIFPELKRKGKIRCVSKGVLMPGMRKRFSLRTPMPPEIRPRDYISDDCQNFSKYSHFYLIRAQSVCPDFYYTVSAAANNVYNDPLWTQPSQIVMLHTRTISLRAGGDSIPTFGQCNAKGTIAAQGFLDVNYGLLDNGSAVATMVEATNGFYGTERVHGDTTVATSGPLAAVSSRVGTAF